MDFLRRSVESLSSLLVSFKRDRAQDIDDVWKDIKKELKSVKRGMDSIQIRMESRLPTPRCMEAPVTEVSRQARSENRQSNDCWEFFPSFIGCFEVTRIQLEVRNFSSLLQYAETNLSEGSAKCNLLSHAAQRGPNSQDCGATQKILCTVTG